MGKEHKDSEDRKHRRHSEDYEKKRHKSSPDRKHRKHSGDSKDRKDRKHHKKEHKEHKHHKEHKEHKHHKCRLLQVSNISPDAPNSIIRELFRYLGRISDFEVYPSTIKPDSDQKVAYVKYEKSRSAVVAQFMNGTSFFERPLVCLPYTSNRIPSERSGLSNIGAAVFDVKKEDNEEPDKEKENNENECNMKEEKA